MILSDREIRAAINRQSIRITPDPRQDNSVWSFTAIDLHLDKDLAFWKHPSVGGVREPVCPFHPDYNYAQLVQQFGQSVEMTLDGYSLTPGSFHQGWTVDAKFQLQVAFVSGLTPFGMD